VADNTRAKRPTLERSAPIRSWSGLVRSPDGAGATTNGGSAGERIDDVIVRSVELGYRVIDDYIKRGQDAARRMQHGTYGAGDMARDAQGVAGQLVRSAADLAGAWIELLALGQRDANGTSNGNAGAAPTPAASESTGNGAPAARSAAPQPPPMPSSVFSVPSVVAAVAPSPPAPAAVSEVLRVRLQVTAARPVETALELRPVPADHALVAHALRGPGAARIDDVRVATRDGSAVIAIRVAGTEPPGHYTGLVFDDVINVPVGEVTVVVLPD
jgi:hypothetical protein